MFSSNVGFRRRTVSEGYNQLLAPPPPSSSRRTSSTSHRHSLDESATASSSTTVKRVVLRKHSVEPTTPRSGLADRIARSEVENINGFWSRRLSGQRRSHPSSPKQTEPDVAQWRREARDKESTTPNAPERMQTHAKPRGPRPLSKISVTSAQRSSSYLFPSGMPSMPSAAKVTEATSMVSVNPAIRTDIAFPDRLSDTTSRGLAKTKSGASNTSASGRGKGSNYGLTYRPLLPPGLPIPDSPGRKAESKPYTQEKSMIREKEKRRFVFELVFNRLVGGKKASSNHVQPQHQSTALTVYSGKKHISLLPPLDLPSSLAIPLIPAIPIPPIPTDTDAQVSRSRPRSIRSVKSVKSTKSAKSTKSNKSSKSGKSAKRKSSRSRKRKTGLARIVVELAKGEKIIAMDAEAIQEAAQVRDIMEQLRQMKAT